ncbi:MAG TPA: hypothetical protein VFS05_03765 [Gemmatimonadaceae bacterium]|nr:hypothetical protein [Gemmatimonadaceae bacterium]
MPAARRMLLLSAALLWGALPAIAGCHHKQRQPDGGFDAVWFEPDAVVPLRVENHHWSDVTIYLERDGQRQRIGTATAATISNVDFPARLLAPGGVFRLIADPIGSRQGLRSELLSVQPGQGITWTLESQLLRSSVAVW